MLSDFTGIADLIAAIGVIASLLFLTYELRAANRETKLANWRQLLDSYRVHKAVTNDLIMSDLIERGHKDYHALSNVEQRSFGMYIEQGIHVMGNFLKHSGKVPKELHGLEMAIHNSLLDLLRTEGARAWWQVAEPKGMLLPTTRKLIAELQSPGQQPIQPD